MINKNDKVWDKEIYVVIEIKTKETLFEIINELSCVIPYTVSDWIDAENNIKKNIIFVHNNNILNKTKLNEAKFIEGDTLEILSQFAGG